MAADLTVFRCVPLGTKLRRESCGARHAVGKDATCAACPTGKAHKRGEEPARWPDGSPIVELRWRDGVGWFTTLRPRMRTT